MKRLLALALILSACTTVQPQPQEQEPQKAQPCAKGTWCAVWTDTVKQKITPAMLAANVGSFCPNAAKLDRKVVWLNIVKAIAYAESGWDVDNTYVESAMGTDPVTGKQVVSEGLFQMSYQDARNWSSVPACKAIDFAKKNIREPAINLGCALGIMDRLAARGGSDDISSPKSLGAYWSAVWAKKTAARAKMRKLMPECGV